MTDYRRDHDSGAEAFTSRWETRREAHQMRNEVMPPLEADLRRLKRRKVPAEAAEKKGMNGTWKRKKSMIAPEFVGLSELSFLNAQCIAHLRRESFPEHIPALFRRLWTEEADHLLSELDLRWQVSSAMTFADHGAPGPEQSLGMALKMLFGLMKLYEFERLYSGYKPNEPYQSRRKAQKKMPLEMDMYSLKRGGLDANLLGPLYALSEDAPVLRPLALNLLTAINIEQGTIFTRIDMMKADRAEERAAKDAGQRDADK